MADPGLDWPFGNPLFFRRDLPGPQLRISEPLQAVKLIQGLLIPPGMPQQGGQQQPSFHIARVEVQQTPQNRLRFEPTPL